MKIDFLSNVLKTTYADVISEWTSQGLSEQQIAEKLTQANINNSTEQLFNQAVKDYNDFFMKHIYEISHSEKIKADVFFAHQNEIWGECFAVSETMYVMAVEAAEEYVSFVKDNVSEEEYKRKQYTYVALQYMHGRCCQQFLEILYLMKLGFADCAYARWRSMYELCCNAAFIVKHGEIIAKQFVEQSQTDEYKYKWTTGAKKKDGSELKVTTFKGIQDNCDVDPAWRKQYRLSCLVNHGSPQGTFNRLGTREDQAIISVGHSDYGITTPAEHSAISLQWITAMYLRVFPSLDALAHIRVIYDWVEVVRESYFKRSDECFGTNINYRKS